MMIPSSNRFISVLIANSGEASAYKMVNGTPTPQSVELGLRNERESQIPRGLDGNGYVVALVTRAAPNNCSEFSATKKGARAQCSSFVL